MCRSALDIYFDDTFTSDGINGDYVLDIDMLNILMKEVDFESVRAQLFTGVCPSAYDGIQAKYTFFILS
ncbi:MAG: hypothetical protein COZ49_00200 [Candidatus Yonathbacteria bacterium CG_4_10_14_3_um_filter_47_65]|uniref:Uncharacterized protein n=1 Tax=Candidatus Yonathbacteria bacterium CG_4_9_14_0_8_um_filter_46_47 TaxID=1975106 RepID=A0A2M8D6D8_9BACT|nr:hypothetical protein [bacterium]PIP03449.1 MAG: hypothetical protein COX54_03650 [Candidatus Yonathbacteria bacterium CG23_combo_of_CG06-09_8_20_14_all_46_18]PIQ31863.1 MAG: hypothetical protein COW61_03190 [Candidatus Yonathbacteria bacterium CG17_big_fil_post_rev_8_21_14_2_50_46_19]PIX56794.1 MAG: hypothetical protein COZ49_00200 [Candidatus Yonathbacteria bacterium CG_4_10_14_3_um_filter_47_65]PJB82439.1 MAG: hypothetical protein CO088_03470 [Candidatus Yonathbacteria bacterium CG_4_9_14_